MTLRDVSFGEGSCDGEARVGYSFLPTVTEDARGLSGVAGSLCCRYHTNTVEQPPSQQRLMVNVQGGIQDHTLVSELVCV